MKKKTNYSENNEIKFCKVIISDEAIPLMNDLKEFYPELFSFICGLHKMKNILSRISKNSVGEDYF